MPGCKFRQFPHFKSQFTNQIIFRVLTGRDESIQFRKPDNSQNHSSPCLSKMLTYLVSFKLQTTKTWNEPPPYKSWRYVTWPVTTWPSVKQKNKSSVNMEGGGGGGFRQVRCSMPEGSEPGDVLLMVSMVTQVTPLPCWHRSGGGKSPDALFLEKWTSVRGEKEPAPGIDPTPICIAWFRFTPAKLIFCWSAEKYWIEIAKKAGKADNLRIIT